MLGIGGCWGATVVYAGQKSTCTEKERPKASCSFGVVDIRGSPLMKRTHRSSEITTDHQGPISAGGREVHNEKPQSSQAISSAILCETGRSHLNSRVFFSSKRFRLRLSVSFESSPKNRNHDRTASIKPTAASALNDSVVTGATVVAAAAAASAAFFASAG